MKPLITPAKINGNRSRGRQREKILDNLQRERLNDLLGCVWDLMDPRGILTTTIYDHWYIMYTWSLLGPLQLLFNNRKDTRDKYDDVF